MVRYKPYEKYKDSGVEWIGEMPEHWSLSQVNKHFDICLGKMLQPEKQIESDTLEKYLCSVNIDSSGIILDVVKEMWFSSVERTKYEIVQGDLLVCEGGDVGKVALWDGSIYPCYIQNALHRLRPLRDNSNKFLMYWFIFLKTVGYIDMVCNKATMAHFTREKVARTVFIVLPLREQQTIANFLNQKTSEVDRLIADKEKLVTQVQEYRQAIISEAVTKGLSPDVKMKDSGVEWIGEIPEHWTVSKLKYLTTCLDGKRVPLNSEERSSMHGDIPYWGANCIIDYVDGWLFNEELVLLGEDGAPFFDNSKDVAFYSIGKIWPNNHVHVLRASKNFNAKYLVYCLNTVDYRDYINGSTRDKLVQSEMNTICIQFPQLSEQQAIADYLDRKTAEIDDLISGIQESIHQLKSYRQSLISEAVTGKIDVRGVI